MAKRRASTYVARRADAWVKIKCQRRLEFVIGGYTDPQGGRAPSARSISASMTGEARLRVKVGTGFDGAELDRSGGSSGRFVGNVALRCGHARRARAPLGRAPARRGGAVHRMDRDGGIRHPTYLGLRDDVRPEDCRRELPRRRLGRPSSASRRAGRGEGGAAGAPSAPKTRATRGWRQSPGSA